ncbi:MAG: hypothetical protein PHS17_18870, partial [Desulfobacterales bacterium]|nr:hypothetical protein [Desulfobacterales bacterium]
MKIADFIQSEILLPRVKKSGVLAVYDPDRRYRDLCIGMASETLRVVDASESSIISREEAMKTLLDLGRPGTELEGLIVHVPAKAPLNDEERQVDPFALYAVCGGIFPDGDGDEFMSICLRAKPDHATEIRRIFAETPDPSFAVIDAVGSGTGWPNLQTLLKQESSRDLLFSLLAPSDSQKHALKAQDGWVSEAKILFETCLGLKLITRGKTWGAIGDELWRFLLFSEFVFDLNDPLPESLANVPCAVAEAKALVEDLCDRLRNDRRTQASYIDRAASIERELDLPAHSKAVTNLGSRDTFPFEERASLGRALGGILRGEVDLVRSILEQQKGSVWLGIGESQAQWGLVGATLALCEACEDYERQLPEYSGKLEDLIEFYLGSLREVDRLHREFEQTVSDLIDAHPMMASIIEKARGRYRRFSARVQDVFIRHLERT